MKAVSKNFKRGAVATVFGGSLLLTAGIGMAGAEPAPTPSPAPAPSPAPSPAPAPVPDGLVSVTQGSTTVVDNAPADVAASAVTQLCGPVTADVTALVQQVDTQGVSQTVCAGLPAGDVTLAQNAVIASPTFPGVGAAEEAIDPAEEPAAEVPPASEGSTEGDLTGAGAAEPPSTEGEESSAGTEAPAVVEGGE
jgi:hypothetical protein